MMLQGVPSYVNIASKAAKYNNLVIRMQQWGCNNGSKKNEFVIIDTPGQVMDTSDWLNNAPY